MTQLMTAGEDIKVGDFVEVKDGLLFKARPKDTTEGNWEERFDKEFTDVTVKVKNLNGTVSEVYGGSSIKSFIEKAITKAREEERDRVLKKVIEYIDWIGENGVLSRESELENLTSYFESELKK